jgi:hypothetical protein
MPLRTSRAWRTVDPIGPEWLGVILTYQSLFAQTEMFLVHATDPGQHTLVIFDEVHHAGTDAAWGISRGRRRRRLPARAGRVADTGARAAGHRQNPSRCPAEALRLGAEAGPSVRRGGAGQRRQPADEVGGLLGDHDHECVGVSARDLRHN